MDLSTDTLVDAAPAAAFAALVGALASEPVLDALARKLADRLPHPEAEQAEGFLSVDEAARYLACKPQRIYDLRSQGRLRCRKDGSRLLTKRSWIDDYLDTQEDG